MKCPTCGGLVTADNVFCDGIICDGCGKMIHDSSCDGKCGSCLDVQASIYKSANYEWLKRQNIWGKEVTHG